MAKTTDFSEFGRVNVQTDRKTELKPREWWERIKQAIKYRNERANTDRWETLRKFYKNKFSDQVQPYNLIYQAVEDLRAVLVARHPTVAIDIRLPVLKEFIPVVEAIDNKLIRVMKLRQQLDISTIDEVLYGTRILKIGYDSQYGWNPELIDEDRAGEPGAEVALMRDETRETALTSFDKKGRWIEYREEMFPGMPWVQRVSPWMFVVEPGVASVSDARWVAHNIWRPLEDVEADPKYKNTANLNKRELKVGETAAHVSGVVEDANNPLLGVPRGVPVVSLWEIRDVKTGKVYVIPEDPDRFLRNQPDVLQHVMQGLPFTAYSPHADGDCFWGISDAEYLHAIQTEMNEARTQWRSWRRAVMPKIVGTAKALDVDQQQRLVSRDMLAYVELSEGKELGKDLTFWNPQMPADLPFYIQRLGQEAKDVTGIGRIARGADAQPPRKTAKEVESTVAGGEMKPRRRRQAIADMTAEALTKVNAIIYEFWPPERVAELVGPEAAVAWDKIQQSRLGTRYMVEVNPDTMAPTDRVTRMKTALLLFDKMGNDPYVDKKGIRVKVFNQFDGYDAKELVVDPPPPPPGAMAQGAQPPRPTAARGGGRPAPTRRPQPGGSQRPR